MGSLKSVFGRDQKKWKRGEREAKSLIQRRRISFVQKFVFLGLAFLLLIGGGILWKNGTFSRLSAGLEKSFNQQLTDAGLVVGDIRTHGNKYTLHTDVIRAMDIRRNTVMVDVDLKQLIINLENLPWVKRANISRVLPNILDVKIEEYVPIAVWQLNEKIWIIDNTGHVITDKNATYFSDLPHLVGKGANERISEILEIKNTDKKFFENFKTGSLISERRWDITLKNGIKVKLPQFNRLEAWKKLMVLNTKEKLLAREILTVDLRLKDKLVIRLTPEEMLRRQMLAEDNNEGNKI